LLCLFLAEHDIAPGDAGDSAQEAEQGRNRHNLDGLPAFGFDGGFVSRSRRLERPHGIRKRGAGFFAHGRFEGVPQRDLFRRAELPDADPLRFPKLGDGGLGFFRGRHQRPKVWGDGGLHRGRLAP